MWGGAVVSDSAMRSHMHELRQVLGEGVIETVIGRGYRFVAAIVDEALVPAARVIGPVDPLVVGREAELEVLHAALERACSGQRQVCFVTGTPGIGKTTLVRTFLASVESTGVSIGAGYCFEQHGTPEPYFAVIEALTGMARSGRGSQTVAALMRYAPTFVTQVPNLVSDEQLGGASRRSAGGNESRQLREVCEALEAMCSQEPLVLVLEDLQWSDRRAMDIARAMGARVQEQRAALSLAEVVSPKARSPRPRPSTRARPKSGL